MAKEGIWWTAPAEGPGGETIMVTGRDALDVYRESGKYKDRIELSWPYEGGGMPPVEIQDLMEQADTALKAMLSRNKGAVLTGIYTGAGKRTWILYAKSTSIFQSIINLAWKDLPILPVRISAERDPEWHEYAEMRELTYIHPSDD